MADAIKEVRVLKFKNTIARVRIPDLTEEERERRMKEVRKAAADVIRAKLESDRKKKESKENESA